MNRWDLEEVAARLLEDTTLEDLLHENDLTESEALAILMEYGHVKVPEWGERQVLETDEE